MCVFVVCLCCIWDEFAYVWLVLCMCVHVYSVYTHVGCMNSVFGECLCTVCMSFSNPFLPATLPPFAFGRKI